MPAYLIAQVKVTDESWVPAYGQQVHDLAARHGGKYLSRSANVTTLEGDSPDVTLVALLEFPNVDAVKAFANDPDYAPHGKARQAGSRSTLYVIDDTDVAGAIPYLPKGGS